eukprot:TRINITY_DN1429_c12_g1_i1.p1 TRINITY_DN1429_c12_g1~~TRINITY_DN1429_c12_g1_i1.p1  ORF type:complete len:283 (+),score=82.60 TRINITY_DN1429_c12_g1_i1:81-929(+)
MAADELHVRQVLRSRKDYYGIFGVSRNATSAEITKAYRKLSLKVHPDRNRAPGAEEAFKVASGAHTVLTDSDKRQVYDVHGEDGLKQGGGGGGGGGHRGYHQPPEDVFDLFGQLFGAHVHRTRRHHHHQQQQQHHAHPDQQAVNFVQSLFQFLPLILAFLFVNGGFWLNDEPPPPFSLSRDTSQGFTYERSTRGKDIRYFVTPQFHRALNHDRRATQSVDRQVEDTFKLSLRRKCKNEKAVQHNLRQRAAMHYGDEKRRLRQEADSLPMSNCKEYKRLFQYD